MYFSIYEYYVLFNYIANYLFVFTKLWPTEIKYNKVFIFLFDGTNYLRALFTILHELFLKMVHVTCVIHGLNRVNNQIRCQYLVVNELISSVKQFLQKQGVVFEILKTLARNSMAQSCGVLFCLS